MKKITMLLMLVCVGVWAANVADVHAPDTRVLRVSECPSYMDATTPVTGLATGRQEDTISYDNYTNVTSVGYNTTGFRWGGAIRLSSDELGPYAGYNLIAVVYYHAAYTTTNDSIKIYGHNTPTQPGAVITAQGLTPVVGAWNRVDLTSPVAIDGVNDIWIAKFHTENPGGYPLGAGPGPYVATKGDWVYDDVNGWYEMGPIGLNYNWNIWAIVEPGGALDHDVGTTAILDPPATVQVNASVDPRATYRNFGTNNETFDVYFFIDSSGTNVYSESASITLNAGDDTTYTWPTWTAGGSDGLVYDIMTYTDLSGDENPANDTLTSTTTTSAWTGWTAYSAPSGLPDRLTHATVFDSDNDMIYMIGGTPNGTTGSNVAYIYAYNPTSDSWNTTLTSMPTPRGWIQGAYWNGYIYTFGGLSNTSTYLNVNEIYDIAGNSWSTGTVLPEARLAHGTVVWNGNIYVIGGRNTGGNQTNTVYRYDIGGDSWTTATALPVTYDMGGCTIWDNVIYICGGIDNGNAHTNVYAGTIDTGNPDNITWATLDALPTPNSINGATALQGKIYMLGGFLNLATVTNDFWQYEPGTGTWTQLADYPYPIVRNHFVIGRHGSGEIFGVAGDANGDWGPPNNYYYKIGLIGIEEYTDPVGAQKALLAVTPSVGSQNATISFSITSPSSVSLTLFNTVGQKVSSLFDGMKEAGDHSVTIPLHNLPAGVYFVNLQTDELSATQKLIITR